MKPIFTIHAGEFLVGEELERRYPSCEVWIPTRDTGTDLLISNRRDRSRNASIQVKFSKDFLPAKRASLHNGLLACGWWTLPADKIEKSTAEFWILAPYAFSQRKVSFLIIRPADLLGKLKQIHGGKNRYNVYFWVTQDGKCFETRGIGRQQENDIADGQYDGVPATRDFSAYLENWTLIENKIA